MAPRVALIFNSWGDNYIIAISLTQPRKTLFCLEILLVGSWFWSYMTVVHYYFGTEGMIEIFCFLSKNTTSTLTIII
jgi:hypothetical protein